MGDFLVSTLVANGGGEKVVFMPFPFVSPSPPPLFLGHRMEVYSSMSGPMCIYTLVCGVSFFSFLDAYIPVTVDLNDCCSIRGREEKKRCHSVSQSLFWGAGKGTEFSKVQNFVFFWEGEGLSKNEVSRNVFGKSLCFPGANSTEGYSRILECNCTGSCPFLLCPKSLQVLAILLSASLKRDAVKNGTK